MAFNVKLGIEELMAGAGYCAARASSGVGLVCRAGGQNCVGEVGRRERGQR